MARRGAGRLHADHGERVVRVWTSPQPGENTNAGVVGDYPSKAAARAAIRAHRKASGITHYRLEPLKYRVVPVENAAPAVDLLPDGATEEVVEK